MSAPSFSLTLQTLFQVISRNASQTETHFDDYNNWVDSDAPVHVAESALPPHVEPTPEDVHKYLKYRLWATRTPLQIQKVTQTEDGWNIQVVDGMTPNPEPIRLDNPQRAGLELVTRLILDLQNMADDLIQMIQDGEVYQDDCFDDYNSWVDSDAPVHVYAAAQCLLKQPPTVPIEDALQFLFDTVEHGLSWGHYVSLFEICLCFRRLNDSRAV